MAVNRHGPAHRVDDLQLARGVVEMIVAADHMGDAHVEIVDHDREHIGRRAVGPQQHHVVELLVGEAHIALHDVVHDGLAGLRRLEPDNERRARRRFARIAVAPASVVAHGLAGGALLRAHLFEFLRGREAAIGFAFREQLFGDLAMPAGAGELIDGLAVPVEPQPFEPARIAATASGVERSRSVSSMRSRNVPPVWRAKSQLNRAVRAPPICRNPVGEGAKRRTGFEFWGMIFPGAQSGRGPSSKPVAVGVALFPLGRGASALCPARLRSHAHSARSVLRCLANATAGRCGCRSALATGIGIYFALPSEPSTTICYAWDWQAVVAIAAGMSPESFARALLALAAAASIGFGDAKLRTELVAAPVLTHRVGPIGMDGQVIFAQVHGKGVRAVFRLISFDFDDGPAMPKSVRVSFRVGGEALVPGASCISRPC
jgi:hypothetical protein